MPRFSGSRPGWRWRAGPALDPSAARDLEREVTRPGAAATGAVVSASRHRTVFRLPRPDGAEVALKEVRHRRLSRRVGPILGRPSKVAREFAVAAAFGARGGRAPEPLLHGEERRGLLVVREWLVTRWLADHRTLTAAVGECDDAAAGALLGACAAALVEAAARGLVHGGQSGDNVLVATGAEGPRFALLDFAEARLGPGLSPPGLARDAVRLAGSLRRRGVVGPAPLEGFLEAVVREAVGRGAGPDFLALLRREETRLRAAGPAGG